MYTIGNMGNETDQSRNLPERFVEGGSGFALLYIGLKELLTNVAHFHFGPLIAGAVELLVGKHFVEESVR